MDIFPKKNPYLELIAIMTAFVMTFYCMAEFYRGGQGSILISESGVRIADFNYYIFVVRGFWEEVSRSIYSIDGQRMILSHALGQPLQSVMPYGLTPSSLIVFYPFAALFPDSPDMIMATWMTLSIFIFGYGLYRFHQHLFEAQQHHAVFLFLIWSISASSLSTMILGQTSLAATGLLLLLSLEVPKQSTRWQNVSLIVITTLLSIKPTYLLCGLIILLCRSKITILIASIVTIILIQFALTPLLGWGWWNHYFDTVAQFSSTEVHESYSPAFASSRITTFFHAFSNFFGATFALAFTQTVFSVGLMIGLINSLWNYINGTFSFLPTIIVISSVVLFSPYLGGYDDLLLLVAVALSTNRQKPSSSTSQFILITSSFALANSNILGLDMANYEVWWIKFIVVITLIKSSLRPIRWNKTYSGA